MTNETQQTSSTETKPIPFGERLKSARESLGFERKDAAAQLRLNEKIIIMMEKERYPADLPVTFIRGYLRAYGKLLQIPEFEIKKALEPIKPRPIASSSVSNSFVTTVPMTSGNSFMQLFTTLIVLTLVGLVGMWWYSHTATPSPMMAENTVALTPENTQTNNMNSPTNLSPAPMPAPQATTLPPAANPAHSTSETGAESYSAPANEADPIKTQETIKKAPAKRIARAKPMVPVEEAIPSDGPLGESADATNSDNAD